MAKTKAKEAPVEGLRLYVRTFGGFSVRTKDDSIRLEDKGRSRKVWNLLEFLMINRHREVSYDELLETMWREEQYDTPPLKNLIYRLRSMLSDHGLPGDSCVLLRRGSYSWNNAIECEADNDQFEQFWKKASNTSRDDEERLTFYMNALELYRGKFLPKSEFEEWVIPLTMYYHRIYLECVAGAFRLLSAKEEHETGIRICNHAISIDPYDEEIYRMLIYAQIRLGRHKEALASYRTISNLLFNELGVNPSKKLREMYDEIMRVINDAEVDIAEIKSELQEDNDTSGAYYCDYEAFKYIYQFVARGIERSGRSTYIMVCTLSGSSGQPLDIKAIAPAMERLNQAIRLSLRREDLYSRYSSVQYLLLLSGLTDANAHMIARRIASNYRELYTGKMIRLTYSLRPVEVEVRI